MSKEEDIQNEIIKSDIWTASDPRQKENVNTNTEEHGQEEALNNNGNIDNDKNTNDVEYLKKRETIKYNPLKNIPNPKARNEYNKNTVYEATKSFGLDQNEDIDSYNESIRSKEHVNITRMDNYAEQRNEPSLKKNISDYGDNIEYEVYIGELNFDATEEDVRNHFESCGDITQIKLIYRNDGKSRGRGFIKFGDEESMRNALNLHDSQMMGRRIVVETPANVTIKKNKPSLNPANASPEDGCNVIVRNIPFRTQEEDLERLFEDCGYIKNCKIMRNPNGSSKGFGFVDFAHSDEAKRALNKSGTVLQGRNIIVDYSTPRDGKQSFGGIRKGRSHTEFSERQGGFRNESFGSNYGY